MGNNIKPAEELTQNEREEISAECVRNALCLLAALDYEIYHNGHKLRLTGKASWAWVKP